ncbi:hypothetical protein IRJ41_022953 [Triplophysa rosa]|uniref:Uncharacterized protein n=1 Tax=Triplophysa rosa TaxID=992332 RepID=A0A9W8C7U0_TRIRA|nr:hypothetical protein IRJ41_022953 [Triplophysa rosa]
MCAIIRGAVLLHLLCFWTHSSVDAIDPRVMASIIRDIRAVTNRNNQYSFAVVLPREECNHQGTHSFGDSTQQIRRGLRSISRIYEGNRVIAARPMFNDNLLTDHAEYRLLTDQQGPSLVSEMSGIIRGAVLLHILCFWTQSCVDAIDPNVMASIIRDIRAVYVFHLLYAQPQMDLL